MKPTINQATGPRWIDQTEFLDSNKPYLGNCTEACVASWLGVSLHEVPKFRGEDTPLQTLQEISGNFWTNVRRYFKSQGWKFLGMEGNMPFGDCIVLVIGKSNRGVNHACLARDGIIVHDPHPSRDGIEKIDLTYYLIPHDPLDFGKC